MVISQRYDWSRFIPSMGQNHEKFTAHHRNAANRIESRHVQKSTVWQIHLAAFGPTKITACHRRFIIADRQHVFTPLDNCPPNGIRVFLMKMSWHFKRWKLAPVHFPRCAQTRFTSMNWFHFDECLGENKRRQQPCHVLNGPCKIWQEINCGVISGWTGFSRRKCCRFFFAVVASFLHHWSFLAKRCRIQIFDYAILVLWNERRMWLSRNREFCRFFFLLVNFLLAPDWQGECVNRFITLWEVRSRIYESSMLHYPHIHRLWLYWTVDSSLYISTCSMADMISQWIIQFTWANRESRSRQTLVMPC